MSQKLQKKSRKLFYFTASLFLSLISFAGGIFGGGPRTNNTAYADTPITPIDNGPPCPAPGCCS